MTTIAIIGAGPGLGAAVARRFGREGFDVALVARDRRRLDDLVEELAADGVTARGFPADVRKPEELVAALAAAVGALGTIEVLQYSPVPHRDFMRPVLETRYRDLLGPIEFSVYGPVAAVQQVLPGMRALGRGTILFVNGGSAAVPHPERAGTSIAFAAESAYGHLLHDRLTREGIHVAQLVIPGAITPGHVRKDPAVLADTLWGMHRDRHGFRHYADDLDS
ncbi:short-subunit dehydrogenase [Streptomyces griseochromogenes]|uniref:Dehydrogenase n=1 Tax=Streptomyces griseochromogenes TaxID=68214 RepID=A0A1B1AP32_9ACTN|nr:SDR family NAD(P)-dependent oxidoreductase [Streptomyces griseochromogenes]ANP48329.1 dehydrogenase [Streptomyces griseochromogenes]MBP2050729.1 short-subunit dehydrogenase [Streptomyces griseochromogenes]